MTVETTPASESPLASYLGEYDPAATVHCNQHILAIAPTITFDGETYPSVEVHEREGFYHASFRLTLTGDAEQRRAVAGDLRAAANAIDAWTKDESDV